MSGKNWLFYQTPDGAASVCGLYSLIETVRQNGCVPSRYLTYFSMMTFLINLLLKEYTNLESGSIFIISTHL
jgi:hypothetical protein